MNNLIERENKIFEMLKKFTNKNLDFIIVGGYAVSSYKHRFSTDADIVIKKEDLNIFEKILKKHGFIKTKSKKFYSTSFARYKKGLIKIDLMIGVLTSSKTETEFSFEFLLKHSSKRKIIGIEKKINVLVPRKEVLIITKIHSARLTDFRDIAALADNINLEFLKTNLFRGNKEIVLKNLKKLKEINHMNLFHQ